MSEIPGISVAAPRAFHLPARLGAPADFPRALPPVASCPTCGGRMRELPQGRYCPACKQREDLRTEMAFIRQLRERGVRYSDPAIGWDCESGEAAAP